MPTQHTGRHPEADPNSFPNWDVLGERRDLEIAPYREEWASLYEIEAERIRSACGGTVIAIEHIGSTAVPGLAAKPVLDIMPGLAKVENGHATVEPMAQLGYEYHGEHGMPGRLHYDRRHAGRCIVHVHMFEVGTDDWERHLLFRDYLRSHPEAAREYEALKKALSARFQTDRVAYTNGKTEFIESVVERSRRDGRET